MLYNHFGRRFLITSAKSMKNRLSYVATRAMSKAVQPADKDYSIKPTDETKQFSKSPIMRNFGELEHGEIPEPLKYVRPFEQTTLSNGIKV